MTVSVNRLRREAVPKVATRQLKERGRERPRRLHRGPIVSTRTSSYKGHDIEIRTSYEIRVDGRKLAAHLHVANDGRVHYHPLPNYSWASAVELVEQLIDSFPDEFPPAGGGKRQSRGRPHHQEGHH